MTVLLPALEALITEDQFDRRFLITKQQQLVLPRVPLQDNFKLPKNAAIHFVATDGIVKGPDSKDWRIKDVDKKIPMQNIFLLTSTEGSPTKLQFNVDNEMDGWFRTNRRFRKSRDVISNDPGSDGTVVYNYSLLPRSYRYGRSLFTEFYRWLNTWRTVIDTINNPESTRNHMLFLPLPRKLPSQRMMQKLLNITAMQQIRELPDPDARIFFELWKWIDPQTRDKSLFGSLTLEKLAKTIIIFEDAGRTMGFRLSTIQNWLRIEENQGKTNLMEPVEMQKRIIRGVLGLMQQRPDAVAMQAGDEGEDGEVRILTEKEDTATEDGVSDDSFATRAQTIIDNLENDIEAHNEIDTALITEESKDIEVVPTILERGEIVAQQIVGGLDSEPIDATIKLTQMLDKASDNGTMTAMDYRRYTRLINQAADAPNPYGEGLASEYASVSPKDTQLSDVEKVPDSDVFVDTSIMEKKYQALDGQYIKNILNRDKVACIQSLQKGGYIVTSHTVEKETSVMTEAEWHTVRITPIHGQASPIRIKVPVINEEGVIFSSGTNYRYRRQRVDLPIRKINATQVALASYFGKTFVTRCDRAAYSYNRWLQKSIAAAIVEKTITNVHTGDCFVTTNKVPRGYSAVSQSWRNFQNEKAYMSFVYSRQEAEFGKEAVDFAAKDGFIIFGKGLNAYKGKLFLLDHNNAVYTLDDGNVEYVSNFDEFLGFDESIKPVEFTECRIGGKFIPVGIMLGYYYGLSALIKMLGARVRQVPVGTRANVGAGEWSLVFEDYTLVFNRDDVVATLVLSGFNQAAKAIKRYSVYHFDKPNVYFNMVESMGLSARYIRLMDDFNDFFIDPITERTLIKMGEPTTFPRLLHRATIMLENDFSKRPLDPTEQRYRGAERIAGAMYNQLAKAMCEHRAKANRVSSKVELNPYNVYKHVMSDPALSMVKDINPVNNLKEITSMTYTGHGGRSARSMTRVQRGIDPNDRGSLSEATVDSSQVGFNAYTSMNPSFTNMEGFVEPVATENLTAGNTLSPAALLSPMINCDDGKRIGMCSIQHSHTIGCENHEVLPIRTGMERATAHMVDSSFASTAKFKGKVKSKNAFGIVIVYDDGNEERFAIGRRFGAAAGMTLPHDMVTDFNVGDTVNAGDVVVYHKNFFAPVPFKKGTVDWKGGFLARVAFMDTRETYEDASSVSQEFANRITTQQTIVRNVVVEFDKEVRDIVQVGQEVNYSDALCLVEDKFVAQTTTFSKDRQNTLKMLSGKRNTAQVTGVVDRIEVYYNGMVDDMSESLKAIVEQSDKELAKRRKAQGKPVVTGAVNDDEMNVEGAPLLLDTMLIRVFITRSVAASSGDKGVICHQLKSEISKVYYKRTTLESKQPVDLFYGSKSLYARVVYSAFKIGTSITLLGLISQKMADIYKGKS